MADFLVNSYSLENIIFTKPKKYNNYLICKIKYPHEDDTLLVQFPKMNVSTVTEKSVELEFVNNKGYNAEVYDFLAKLDTHIIEYISSHSEEWFGKVIPIENVRQMYNKFIKAPKNAEKKCTINFDFKTRGGKIKSKFIDNHENELEVSELVKDNGLECISQFKYIVFSRDTCFTSWELVTAKYHLPKMERVKGYAFIEDPHDTNEMDSDDENLMTFY